MARYGKETRHDPSRVVEEAVEFFGPGGLGLQVKDRGEACALFEGGGGHVYVEVCKTDKGSDVDVETREWDQTIGQFFEKL